MSNVMDRYDMLFQIITLAFKHCIFMLMCNISLISSGKIPPPLMQDNF